MGLYALDHFGLDHLLIIPVSGFPCDAALQDRWAMIVAACSADERLLPFLPESESGEVFSSAFLAILKKRFPKSSFAYLPPPCSDPAAASLSLRLSLLDKKVLAVPDSAISPSSAENFSSFLNPAVHEYCRCKRLYDFSSPLSRGPAWVDALFHSLKPRRFAHSSPSHSQR